MRLHLARATEVLALAKKIDDMDNAHIKLLDDEIPLPEFVKASPTLKQVTEQACYILAWLR